MVATPLLGTGGGAVFALVVALPRKRRGEPFCTPLALKTFERCSRVMAISFLLVKSVRLVSVCTGTRRRLAAMMFARVRPVLGKQGKLQSAEFALKRGWSRNACRAGVCALVFLQALEKSKSFATCSTLVPRHFSFCCWWTAQTLLLVALRVHDNVVLR